ncbi:uncharacterized protein LOC106661833 [Cimex lectularius]|uniref:DUF4795 domain-containing protein n=1 Tax=Cimex lectularius TaxID=79782 RepID=A0A8I6RAQ4_CIMLE|nr:uncharacterized protein LOC106661833 [Cimex lectularius]
MSAAVINLSDLVDLAVGSKNQDEINFKVLQTALQAIIQHLNIQDTKIEFRGADSSNIQNILKSVRDENLTKIPVNIVPEVAESQKDAPLDDQSVLTTDSSGRKKKHTESVEDVVVVESGKVQEPSKKRLITPSFLARLEAKVKALQGQIEALGAQVLPSDDALLQTTRSQQEAKPISDLWQSLNITKRMSGAEEGIDKLASLLETVAKEYADLKIVIDRLEDELGQDMVETMKQIKLAANYAKQIRPREEIYQSKLSKKPPKQEPKPLFRMQLLDKEKETADTQTKTLGQESSYTATNEQMSNRSKQTDDQSVLTVNPPEFKETVDASAGPNKLDPINAELTEQPSEMPKVSPPRDSIRSSIKDSLKESFKKASLESQTLFDVIPPIPRGEPVEREKVNILLAQHEYMKQNVEYLTAQVNALADFTETQLPDLIRSTKKSKHRKEDGSSGAKYVRDQAVDQKIHDLEGRLAKHSSKLKRQDVMITEKTMDYDKRLSSISQTVSSMFDTINSSQNDDTQNSNIIEDLISKVQNIEDAVVEVGCTTQDLQEDKDQKTALLQKIANDLELVKTGKADRYEIEDILAEKADCYAVLEKVSQSVFDIACNDLAKGIDEALNRVSAQESLLAATMLEMQNAMDNKIDRGELDPLKDEISERIEQINKKVEKLSAMKEGRVAAGAKKKYMTNVNCISCDRNVSMKIENDVPCIPAMADLPAMHSIAPYISYELDHLRKLKAKQPGPGTLLEFNDLARRYNIRNLDSYENLVDVPHLQTRYCGGSHTKLGPQQRVTHVGHFNIVKGVDK